MMKAKSSAKLILLATAVLGLAIICQNRAAASEPVSPPQTSVTQGQAQSTDNAQTATTDNQAPADNQATTNTIPDASQPADNNQPPAPPIDANTPGAITIPAGTSIFIRTMETLDSAQTQQNSVFHGTTSSDIYLGNQIVIPAGTNVEGKVTRVQDAAHFAGKSLLALQVTKINVGGLSYDALTSEWSRYGRDRGADTANKVGGGALIGTIIGAVAGGGKGAAIGAGIGAGTGAAVQGATRGQQVRITPERILSFRLQNPLYIKGPESNDANKQQRKPDDDVDY